MTNTDKASPVKINPKEVQKLLSDPNNRIELHNLVDKETERAYKSVEVLTVQTQDVLNVAKKALPDFEIATENLRMVVAYGCYFGTKEQAYLWSGALSRLSTMPQVAGSVFLLKLQLYPALLVLYAGGLSAVAAKNPESLKALFSVQSTDKSREPRELVLDANCTMLGDAGNQIFELERRKTPLSDHLYDLFAETLPKELRFGQDFEQLFDDWEILVGMIVADSRTIKSSLLGSWGPVGRFAWRGEYSGLSTLKALRKELDKDKPDWFPLTAGLFGGSIVRAREALTVIEKLADRVSFFKRLIWTTYPPSKADSVSKLYILAWSRYGMDLKGA